MDALYMVPAFLRELINELKSVDPDKKDLRELYIIDVRTRLNEELAKLSQEDIDNIQQYLINLDDYISSTVKDLAKLRVERPSDPFAKIEDPEQNFIHHVLCDEQNQLSSIISTLNIASEVVYIALLELSHYLPSDDDEKKLGKHNKDISA